MRFTQMMKSAPILPLLFRIIPYLIKLNRTAFRKLGQILYPFCVPTDEKWVLRSQAVLCLFLENIATFWHKSLYSTESRDPVNGNLNTNLYNGNSPARASYYSGIGSQLLGGPRPTFDTLLQKRARCLSPVDVPFAFFVNLCDRG